MEVKHSYDIQNSKVVNHIKDMDFSNPSVEKSLRKIIIKEGFKSYKLVKRMLSTEGGNYLGELYEVNVKGETKDGLKETNIFVKQVIHGLSLKALVNVDKIYTNEVFMYNELGQIFITLQDEAEVPKKERFRMAESYAESSTEAIILDNLTKKGYKTLFRMDVMPLNFAEESIKQLARFHAMSFVLQDKKTVFFEEKIKPKRSLLYFDKPWADFFENSTNNLFEYFEETVINRLKEFRHKMYDKLPKYFNGEMSSVNCLCHGDYRINNILVNDKDAEEIKVVAVDYQLIYYGSPVHDFLYFIYTGTDRIFRNNYLNHLKDLYHETLTSFLKYFDLDVNTIYPRKAFDEDFEKNIDFGLMMSLYVLPFCFTIESEVHDFSKVEVTTAKFKLDKKFKGRLTEIVEDFMELGIL